MIPLEPEVEREYQRVMAQLPAWEDAGPLYLSPEQVVRAHFLIANHFYLEGEGLGGVGPKSIDLLLSAVGRQTVSFGSSMKWTDRFDIAATLFFGLTKNHAFHDANKRTAFLSALFQLQLAGWTPSESEKKFEDFTVEVAESKLEKYARFNDLVRKGDPDPEIRFISWFFRNNMRKIDRKSYAITYRELEAILNRNGFYFEAPQRSFIDIIVKKERRRFFGLGGKETYTERVGQIMFPRWGAQVSQDTIRAVRKMTGLTNEKGVDSGVFYNGLDTMQSLITTYHRPLLSLASR